MLEEILESGLRSLGLAASPEALARFRRYYELLSAGNAVMNLTAITGEAESARLHFLDSAAPLCLFSMAGCRAIDIGSGAGFPGLPLKILCPSLDLTLLDAQRKRVDFLSRTCAALELSEPQPVCIHARAEDCGARREQYDYALSRAVARMHLLAELCLPYVRPGGAFLALKGPAVSEELPEAERALELLGGKVERVWEYPLPGETSRHCLVVIRKLRPTPKQYPRPFAQIKKAPLSISK